MEATEEKQIGPIGDAPFCELRLEPWYESGSAFPNGCDVQLSDAAPLVLLCEALAEELGAQAADITILDGNRVLDNTATIRDNGISIPNPQSNATIKLEFVVAGLAWRRPAAVGSLLEKWRLEPPLWSKRPPLPDAPHLVTESATSSSFRVGSCTAYGPRVANEDVHVCCCDWAALAATRVCDTTVEAPASLFAVCDGHGGSWTSQTVGTYLTEELRRHAQNCEWWDKAARRAAMERGFLALDQRLEAEGGLKASSSGSTCIAAIVWPAGLEDSCSYRVLLANIGDSRGLVLRRGPDELFATRDQKPDQPWEKRRIRAAGGFVLPADPPQPARLDGSLAMSRAFGDMRFKAEKGRAPHAQKVIATPEVYELTAEPGDMVVLACDGVFDVLQSEEVAALAVRAIDLQEGDSSDAVDAASTVCWAALQKDTQDNVTCLVVHLPENS